MTQATISRHRKKLNLLSFQAKGFLLEECSTKESCARAIKIGAEIGKEKAWLERYDKNYYKHATLLFNA